MTTTIQATVDEIFNLYEKRGNEEYIGEPVSQIEHMCQAAQLAAKEGYEDEVILAAFFHDIGHICFEYAGKEDMGGFGHIRHEEAGAAYLHERGFSEKIVRLVKNHVQAKRYLCARKWKYYRALSEASKKTLQYQGGPMTPAEAIEFEKDPLFSLSIKMRMWDEAAKERSKPLPDLNVYRRMVMSHLQKRQFENQGALVG